MVSACICNILQCSPVFSACLQLDFLLIRFYCSFDSNVVLPICGFRKMVDISQTSRALLWIFVDPYYFSHFSDAYKKNTLSCTFDPSVCPCVVSPLLGSSRGFPLAAAEARIVPRPVGPSKAPQPYGRTPTNLLEVTLCLSRHFKTKKW